MRILACPGLCEQVCLIWIRGQWAGSPHFLTWAACQFGLCDSFAMCTLGFHEIHIKDSSCVFLNKEDHRRESGKIVSKQKEAAATRVNWHTWMLTGWHSAETAPRPVEALPSSESSFQFSQRCMCSILWQKAPPPAGPSSAKEGKKRHRLWLPLQDFSLQVRDPSWLSISVNFKLQPWPRVYLNSLHKAVCLFKQDLGSHKPISYNKSPYLQYIDDR